MSEFNPRPQCATHSTRPGCSTGSPRTPCDTSAPRVACGGSDIPESYCFWDTFTDADGTDLTAHTPDLGGEWSTLGGTITIQGNEAQCDIIQAAPNVSAASGVDACIAPYVASMYFKADADHSSQIYLMLSVDSPALSTSGIYVGVDGSSGIMYKDAFSELAVVAIYDSAFLTKGVTITATVGADNSLSVVGQLDDGTIAFDGAQTFSAIPSGTRLGFAFNNTATGPDVRTVRFNVDNALSECNS